MLFRSALQIFWLEDANLAASNSFGVSNVGSDGEMSWATANAWIAALNAAAYKGFSDWRLPTSLNPGGLTVCSGTQCTVSEMGHLHLVDGISMTSQTPFNNISFYEYWSSTQQATDPSLIWTFSFNTSLQSSNRAEATTFRAWAVRPVPEPATALMLFIGVATLAIRRILSRARDA